MGRIRKHSIYHKIDSCSHSIVYTFIYHTTWTDNNPYPKRINRPKTPLHPSQSRRTLEQKVLRLSLLYPQLGLQQLARPIIITSRLKQVTLGSSIVNTHIHTLPHCGQSISRHNNNKHGDSLGIDYSTSKYKVPIGKNRRGEKIGYHLYRHITCSYPHPLVHFHLFTR